MILQKNFSFLTFCCSIISLPFLFHSGYLICECNIEQGSFLGGYSSVSLEKEAGSTTERTQIKRNRKFRLCGINNHENKLLVRPVFESDTAKEVINENISSLGVL